jgi:hypothetical protein
MHQLCKATRAGRLTVHTCDIIRSITYSNTWFVYFCVVYLTTLAADQYMTSNNWSTDEEWMWNDKKGSGRVRI